ATTSNAARQCSAWLSPTSATVRVAASAGTPKAQTPDAPSGATTAQGALGVIAASIGVGITPEGSGTAPHLPSAWRQAPKQPDDRGGSTAAFSCQAGLSGPLVKTSPQRSPAAHCRAAEHETPDIACCRDARLSVHASPPPVGRSVVAI